MGNYPVDVRKRQRNMLLKGALLGSLMAMIQQIWVAGLPTKLEVPRSESQEAVQPEVQDDNRHLVCPKSGEFIKCTKKGCPVDDPCCNGPFCCDKKFWPKCHEKEVSTSESLEASRSESQEAVQPEVQGKSLDDNRHLVCPKSGERRYCTLKGCPVNFPCCNGPFCCDKKFWPKKCQEEEKAPTQDNA